MSHDPLTADATDTPTEQCGSLTPQEITELRPDLVRFAKAQLRCIAAAEDVVQEVIETALRKAATFAGKSSVKTWVFAILRNRIIDHIRRGEKSVNFSSLGVEDDADQLDTKVDELFTQQGCWADGMAPSQWPGPDGALYSRQFMKVFESSLASLPARSAQVFMMREVLGFDVDEICRELGITTSNCHVLLHRARLRLRASMEGALGLSPAAQAPSSLKPLATGAAP